MISTLLISCLTASEVPTWSDVQPIAASRCSSCHHEGGISGITLEHYADYRRWAEPVYAEIAAGTMPPWLAEAGCSSYTGDLSMSADEIDTFLRWIDADMPPGTTTAESAPPDAPTSGLDQVDFSLTLPAPYTPGSHPDDYRCFLLEWPYEQTVWITGYEFRPDNEQVVHHAIPYVVEPASVETYQALDEADEGEGYRCYGSPGGDLEALISARWLGSWAPGSIATQLPEGFGLEVAPGSMIALQMHYFSTGDEGSDQSTFDLQIETTPQAWAELQPWTDVSWLFGEGMEIPAQTEGTTHTFSYTAAEDEDFAIHTASIHMHTLGTSGRFSVKRADGTEDCLLDIPAYDFSWQRGYQLDEPVWVDPGDTVELRCTWDNPGLADVAWGEGTGDEMCLGVTLITGD